MPVIRSLRRYLRIGYISPKSCITNMIYLSIVLFTLSIVFNQLNAQNVPESNVRRFDLHNQLQINRQKAVRCT